MECDNSVDLTFFLTHIPVIQTPVAIDFESNGQDVRDGRGYTQGLSIAYDHPNMGRLAHYLPFRHKYGFNFDYGVLQTVRQRLAQRQEWGGIITSHNIKADLDFADNIGIHLSLDGLYCTLRMAHLIREEMPFSKSLDACCAFYLQDEQKKKSPEFENFTKKVGWENVPSEAMYEYARYDAHLHLALFNRLEPLFRAEVLEDVWRDKRETMNIYRAMERQGVLIDTALCNKMAALGTDEMEDLAHTLGVNPASPIGLNKILIDKLGLPVVKRTKTGRASFDKEAMRIYDAILERSVDPTARLITAYRGWSKSVSSNYKPYVELLSPDGRLRPNYKLHGTKTGRSSCEKPNLQQIPKVSDKPWNGRMKAAFVPREGYQLITFDYAQLEFRLAAAYGQERRLIEIFEDPTRDVFTEMSLDLQMSRNDTKLETYTIQYGGGINRLSQVFSISKERASELRANFYRTYPGLHSASRVATSRALSRGKVKMWSGRYRHFERPKDQAHKAFNAVMQGGAADIVESSQRRLMKAGLGNTDDCMMLLQVHDELVFEIREDLVPSYSDAIKHYMEAIEPDFGVKFRVESKVWGS